MSSMEHIHLQALAEIVWHHNTDKSCNVTIAMTPRIEELAYKKELYTQRRSNVLRVKFCKNKSQKKEDFGNISTTDFYHI